MYGIKLLIRQNQYVMLPLMDSVENIVKEIFYGEIYTLKNGDNFKSLKIHSGGKLLIESGEMIIGDVRSILQNNIWSFSW